MSVKSRREAKRKRNRRRRLIARDGRKCRQCGTVLTDDEITIDHIVPLSRGGCWCIGNLQIMCPPCNQLKSDGAPDPQGPSGHTRAQCPSERHRRDGRRRRG